MKKELATVQLELRATKELVESQKLLGAQQHTSTTELLESRAEIKTLRRLLAAQQQLTTDSTAEIASLKKEKSDSTAEIASLKEVIANQQLLLAQPFSASELAAVDGKPAVADGELAVVDVELATVDGELAVADGELATADGAAVLPSATLRDAAAVKVPLADPHCAC